MDADFCCPEGLFFCLHTRRWVDSCIELWLAAKRPRRKTMLMEPTDGLLKTALMECIYVANDRTRPPVVMTNRSALLRQYLEP
jgi:hypothetical protein